MASWLPSNPRVVIPGTMFSLSKPQEKSDEDNSTFINKAFSFRLFATLNPSGVVLYPPVLFPFSGNARSPGIPFAESKSKMAVSPYVSRAELWLANASFRPSFRLPDEFHPSIFLKWFPGSMAKGNLLIIQWFDVFV